MNNKLKTFAMFKYLSDNYYTLEEIATKANVSTQEIQKMIEFKLIPDYTYKISCAITESSILLGSISAEDNDIEFYHKDNVIWIERAKVAINNKNNNYHAACDLLKARMKQRFYDLFVAHKSMSFGFKDMYDENQNIIDSSFAEQFDSMHKYWCNGTYGICNKSLCDESYIFYKDAYQTLLTYLTDSNSKTQYSPEEFLLVMDAVKKYDHYVSLFSPLSFENSSRNKYINKFVNEATNK